MKALDRKVLRDLRLLWSQALTIALVVASGIGGFVGSLSAVDSLSLARDRFYQQGRFADVFASLKRAPASLEARLRSLPGVVDVQTTVQTMARVSVPRSTDPVVGAFIGIDSRRPAHLNLVSLRSGQWPEPGAGDGNALALAAAEGRELLCESKPWRLRLVHVAQPFELPQFAHVHKVVNAGVSDAALHYRALPRDIRIDLPPLKRQVNPVK